MIWAVVAIYLNGDVVQMMRFSRPFETHEACEAHLDLDRPRFDALTTQLGEAYTYAAWCLMEEFDA